MKTKQKITKNMKFQEIFEKFPNKAEALANEMFKAGLHCFGCAMASSENIEMGCKAHGLSGKDITKLMANLNKIIRKT